MRKLNNIDDVEEGMFMVHGDAHVSKWIGYVGPGKKRFCIRRTTGVWTDHYPISDFNGGEYFGSLYALEEGDRDYLPALLHVARCALGVYEQ